jgi:hypothetical protein
MMDYWSDAWKTHYISISFRSQACEIFLNGRHAGLFSNLLDGSHHEVLIKS